MRIQLATTLAAGLFAVSSFAYAADNNGGKNNGGKTDPSTTSGIKSDDGNTVSIQDREFCIANPSDSKCQGLGGETQQ